MKWSYLALLAAVVALALLLVGGPGTRLELWDFSFGFRLMRFALYAGIVAGLLAIVMLLIPATRKNSAAVLTISLIVGLAVTAFPLQLRSTAQSLPFIHDVTTDTSNPPRFIRVLPLRADAPNPPDYAGEDVARQQREGYPDIESQFYPEPVDQVFAAALSVAMDQGWEIVAEEPGNGRIEATATTFWYGFKDDIVIRIQAANEGSQFDMRSKSRVGSSDIGANAKRIRGFIRDLDEQLGVN